MTWSINVGPIDKAAAEKAVSEADTTPQAVNENKTQLIAARKAAVELLKEVQGTRVVVTMTGHATHVGTTLSREPKSKDKKTADFITVTVSATSK